MTTSECSHPAWVHIGMERYCAVCGMDRDDLTKETDDDDQ